MLQGIASNSQPANIITSENVEVVMSVQEGTNGVQLCITYESLNVARYEFLCRTPFRVGDTTYLYGRVSEEGHVASIKGMVGDDVIRCSETLLKHLFSEEKLVLLYRFAFDVEKARGFALCQRPDNENNPDKIRLSEMTESIKIIQQALEGLPGGPYENLESRGFDKKRNPEWNDFEYRFISKKPSPTFELSKQELYVRVEAPKGELGIFLIGDQSGFPWRWKIRPPGFINLQILPELVKRMKLADIMTILGSIDIIMGEVDR
ncbi:hypothetical protein YC2023_018821 [Brassica napus]